MIDPVAFQVFGFSIHWYGIAWVVSFLWVLHFPYQVVKDKPLFKFWDEIVINTVIVSLVAGRLGEMLIYQHHKLLHDPWSLFRIWEGGMSFYGAAIGYGLYLYWESVRKKVSFLGLTDMVLLHLPIPIFIVRIANFINGELWGRVTDQSWGIYFPKAGPLLRHPSQLYEAFGEGLVLGVLLYIISRYQPKAGVLTASFMVGYGSIRLIIELYYRAPSYDITSYVSTGVILSSLFILGGILTYLWRD